MKTIQNKTYAVRVDPEKNENATTADMILYCIDQVPQAGFSPKDLRDRARIAEAIKGEIEFSFEDSDWKNLCDIVAASRWGIRHPDVLDFITLFDSK